MVRGALTVVMQETPSQSEVDIEVRRLEREVWARTVREEAMRRMEQTR